MMFGRITKYILFCDYTTTEYIKLFLDKERDVYIITSQRDLNENKDFCKFIDTEKTKVIVSEDVNTDDRVLNLIDENTLGISMGAAWIFKKEFISLFKGRLINMHGSLLPRNRGGGGFSWRIMQKDKTGVSLLHLIDAGIDTGDIIKTKYYLYSSHCRVPSDYFTETQIYNISFLKEFLSEIDQEKDFNRTPQQECFASYFPRLNTDIHGYIDWNWELDDIESFILAFSHPYNGASTFINGQKVRIFDCQATTTDGQFHPFQNGIIYKKLENNLFVATKQGTLIITSIKSNVKISVGDRFYTPLECFAKQTRIIYNPS